MTISCMLINKTVYDKNLKSSHKYRDKRWSVQVKILIYLCTQLSSIILLDQLHQCCFQLLSSGWRNTKTFSLLHNNYIWMSQIWHKQWQWKAYAFSKVCQPVLGSKSILYIHYKHTDCTCEALRVSNTPPPPSFSPSPESIKVQPKSSRSTGLSRLTVELNNPRD